MRDQSHHKIPAILAATLALPLALLLAMPMAVAEENDEAGEHVHRAQFTTDIEEREPVDELGAAIDTRHERVMFFTELRDLEGKTASHVWQHEDYDEVRVDFEIGGPRWRVWSNRTLPEQASGTWTVAVVSNDGEVHGRYEFEHVAADNGPESDEPEEAPEEADEES